MVTLLIRILGGLLMGEAVSVVTGVGGALASVWGLLDDVALLVMKNGLSLAEQFALTAAVQEGEKLLDAAEYADTHSRRQREREAHYLERANPHTLYVYGNVSVEDIGILALSAETLAERGVPVAVNQAAFSLYEIVQDVAEVIWLA